MDNEMEESSPPDDFHDPGGFFRGRGFPSRGPRGPPRFRGPPPMMCGPPPHMRGGPPGMMRRPPPPGFRGPPPQHGGFDPNFPPPGMPPGMHPGMPPPGMGPPGMHSPNMQQRPMMPPLNVPPPGYSMMGPGGMPQQPGPGSYTIAGIDFSGEVWVETKTAEGKVYYYNAKSREVSWSKPENVKVLTQEQIEVVAAAAGVAPAGGISAIQGGNQAASSQSGNTPTGSTQDPALTSTEDQDSNSLGGASDNANSSPPNEGELAGSVNPSAVQISPSSGDSNDAQAGPANTNSNSSAAQPPTSQSNAILANPPVNMFQGPPFGMSGMGPPFGAMGGPGMGGPGMGGPGMGGPGMGGPGMGGQGMGGPGGFPTFNMPPPGFQNSMGNPFQNEPLLGTPPGPMTDHKDKLKDEDLSALQSKAAEWTEHQTTDGKFYYYNSLSSSSVWEKPEVLVKLEQLKMRISQRNGLLDEKGQGDKNNATLNGDDNSVDMMESQPSMKELEEDAMTLAKEEAMEREEEKERVKQESQKPMDKSRPVSSNNVPGTPWCVVWTGDGRVFFFNPSTKTSVWEKPDELRGRPDVEKLIQTPPQAVQAAIGQERKAEQEEPPVKKMKIEEAKEEFPGKIISSSPAIITGAPEEVSGKRKIDVGKEAAIEAELRAAKERAAIPLDIRMKQFRDMLIEKEVSAFSTWEKELHKIVFDPRYLLLTSKERKQVFEKYVKERAEEERREKRNKMKERKDDFRKLLESANITFKSTFSDFAQKYGKDERFKNIEKMREKESMFNDYVQELRRKDRDERSSQRERVKKEYLELLAEQKNIDKHSRWSDIKKGISEDARYKAVDSSSQREDWFKDYVNKLDDVNDEATKEREKQERIEASIREREKEVQRTLSTHLRERDKEREQHKHDEAVQHFMALLADLVRNSDASWKDAKRTLRKDHRWEHVSSLDRDERERLFQQHVDNLTRKKKEKFRELLDETSSITFTSSFKEVKKLIREDPRYTKFSSSDRKCEKEFKEYMKDKMVAAKADFRELLKETKLITYKSRKMIDESNQHFEDIEKVLENDKRYLVLECIKDERKKLVISYIDDLDRRGPPPPPTASEPSRRSTK